MSEDLRFSKEYQWNIRGRYVDLWVIDHYNQKSIETILWPKEGESLRERSKRIQDTLDELEEELKNG